MTDQSGPPPVGPAAVAPEPAPGSDDVSRTRRVDALAAYVRAHRERYSDEALRRSALAAGYDPRDIDAAWAVAGEAAPRRGEAGRSVLVAVAYFFGVYLLTVVVLAIPDTSSMAVVVLGAGLILGIVGWLSLRGSRPEIADGLRLGVVIAIVLPIVIGLVVLGLCLLIVAGIGPLTS